MRDYFVYMLECEGKRLYTGYTVDFGKRFRAHCGGRAGAKFTRGFRPLAVAALWKVSCDRGTAMKVEAFIKSLDRVEKDKLVSAPSILEGMISPKEINIGVEVCDVSDYKMQSK